MLMVTSTWVACAEEASRPTFTTEDAEAGPSLPDGSVPPEAAAVDARPPFDPNDEAVSCTGDPCAVELAAGDHHVCARLNTGGVVCWGDDGVGQLGRVAPAVAVDAGADAGPKDAGADAGPKDAGSSGDGGDAGTSPVQRVAGVVAARQVSSAGDTTCARLDDGSVWCWGGSRRGELGRAIDPPLYDEKPHGDPGPVALSGRRAARVDVGRASACAVLSAGGLVCWGRDDEAQLARGPDAGAGDTFEAIRGPGLAITGGFAAVRTTSGTYTRLALGADGALASWGAVAGTRGLLGGRIANLSPGGAEPISGLTSVTSFAASEHVDDGSGGALAHACAVARGALFCWGKSGDGALGNGLPDAFREPFPSTIASPAWVRQVVVAPGLTCVRLSDGTIQCAGTDGAGRLGTGTEQPLEASFVPASAFKERAVGLAATRHAVCALASNGTVWCWGSNTKGELGTAPDDRPHRTPVKVQIP